MADVIEITAEVRERELRLTSIPMMPSGSRNHLQIRVTFDAEWEGTTKTLVAYRDLAHPYHVLLGLDGTALIPHEVLAEQGVVYLGAFGIAGDQRITSTIVRYGVNEGAVTEGLQPSDPTPEMWEQLISAVNEVRQAAESAMRDAQASAQGAQQSEQAAAGSATQADDAATRAETAADTATTAAGNAETAKTDAQTAQRAAAQSAADARSAAARAEQAAGNLSTAVTQAQDAAQAAQQSAASAAQAQQGASNAESTARQAAAEAVKSAQQAAGAQTAAQNSAQSAGQQATAAATYAQQAQQSQTAAAGSATSAQASAAEATKQAAASEASAARAENAANEVEQSAQQIAGAIDRLVIHDTAAGNPAVIRDSADWQMEGLRMYGQSEQAGEPSPESPQDIVSKTVDEIVVTGANLLDCSRAKSNTENVEVTLKGSQLTIINLNAYVAVVDVPIMLDAGTYYMSVQATTKPVRVYNANQWHANGVDNSTKKSTIKIVDNGVYAARITVDAKSTATVDGLMISVIDAPYESYHAKTVKLSAPVTLRGVPVISGGNVTINGQQYMADQITERDGVVGVVRNVIETSHSVADMNNAETHPGWKGTGITSKVKNPPTNTISNVFGEHSISFDFSADIIFLARRDMQQSEWKEKYPNLVFDIWMILAEATFEPLPEQDQLAIRALRTYHGNTVVTTGAHTEVDYIADPKLYIDGKVTNLVTAYMQSIPVTIPLLNEEVVDNEG